MTHHHQRINVSILPPKEGAQGNMNTKMEQFSTNNPNPVLCVEKDGTVLYSNEASEPLTRARMRKHLRV
jgi:hypothetical protein